MECHESARRAAELGYHEVFIMPSGIMGWVEAGKPIVKGEAALGDPKSTAPAGPESHSRNRRAGSVRVACWAGRKQAASEAMMIAAKAEPKASGSSGLTL